MFALAQGRLKNRPTLAAPARAQPPPMPVHANPGLGEGPLGTEDRDNFHP
jgi:hypothetical protein